MNLKSIEYFLMAADEMNFTRAAQRLYISQQALSSHIQRLEEEYSVQLFERRPALHLTLEGQQMVFYSRQILEAEKHMRVAFSDISENCRGMLSVGISRLRGSLFFPKIWHCYHPTHPNISVELVDGNTNSLDALLQNGKVDLFVGIDIPENPKLQRVELVREKVQYCLSQKLLEQCHPQDWPEYLSRFQGGISFRQIADFPLITMRRGNRLRDKLESAFPNDFQPQFIFECDQQDLIYELSKQSAGVGLLSPLVLYQNLQEIQRLGDTLHFFPLKDDVPDTVVYLVYRRDQPLPHYAADFIQTACLVFRNYSRTIEEHFS